MKRRGLAVALAATVALTLSACGVGRGSAVTIEEGDPIKVGVLPVADFVSVYIALDHGYFADEGLNVQTQVMQNAAAIAPSVINGQLQFGTGAVTPFIAAAQKGLPLTAVANMADVPPEAEDPSALLAREGSGITRPKDLEGRTVAVNGLGAIVHVAAAQAVVDDGGDPDEVTFVAMPFPDMMQALAQGRIDAASVVEPFATIGESQGSTVIARPYSSSFGSGETFAVMFSAGPFVEENPEVTERFVRALNRANEEAATNRDAVEQALITHGRMEPGIVSQIRLPGFGTEVSADAITAISQDMDALGFIPAGVDGRELVWP